MAAIAIQSFEAARHDQPFHLIHTTNSTTAIISPKSSTAEAVLVFAAHRSQHNRVLILSIRPALSRLSQFILNPSQPVSVAVAKAFRPILQTIDRIQDDLKIISDGGAFDVHNALSGVSETPHLTPLGALEQDAQAGAFPGDDPVTDGMRVFNTQIHLVIATLFKIDF